MRRPRRLDDAHAPAKNEPPVRRLVRVIEHPDPDGQRWARAIELLLEAGRAAPEATPDQ